MKNKPFNIYLVIFGFSLFTFLCSLYYTDGAISKTISDLPKRYCHNESFYDITILNKTNSIIWSNNNPKRILYDKYDYCGLHNHIPLSKEEEDRYYECMNSTIIFNNGIKQKEVCEIR